ncbi:hypothetical protein GW17_00061240, partial [Ensete ventricosum]
VRGIANSKDLELIQELVHGRQSVRGHPKVRSKLSAMEHQNFLFDIKGYVRMIEAAGELDCFSAHIRLREPDKSEDKADKASVRKEVDSEEHHSAVEADLPIAKEGMQM